MLYLNTRFLTLLLPCIIALLTASVAVTADPLDLTTDGSSGYINQALFIQVDPEHSTGTGIIRPFLRIQAQGTEQGYNTDYRPHEFNEATDTWTKSLMLSLVPIVNIGGVNYREFLLDINESSGSVNSLLSLDMLQIFMGSEGNLTGYPSGLGTLVWDMDAGPEGDTWIKLDYALEAGSGDGDMLAYIPSSLFTGGTYVYLYSAFGGEGTKTNGLGSSDGFEEWSIRESIVPEPAGLMVLSAGLIPVVGVMTRRWRRV